MNAQQILIAAKALIPDEAHWWRGNGIKHDDRHCIMTALGAIVSGQGCWPDIADAESCLITATHNSIPGTISAWNDAPERTYLDIMQAFDRAIALAGKKED